MEAAGEETPKENTANDLPQNSLNPPEASPAAPPLDVMKKSKSEDRLKVDKNVEAFMKSLNSVPTLDEKFSLVCKKYTQTSDENRRLHFFIKQTDKRFAMLEKEKDHLQFEHNKVILLKSKLENLCRELQKQNRAVKEESLLKIREEEERRKETQAKFQSTLTEITTLLQQNNEKNTKLRDDNITMTEKFKSVVQQYQLREQQVEKMAKQMSLESQLADAKLQKAALEHQAEKESLLAEMEHLKVTLAQYRSKILELQGTETVLKNQLAVYTEKYDEFQNALVRSNQMFGGFKEQMEKMSKKIQKLEKESLSWKKRWETSQAALLDMCGERQASDDRGAVLARQLQQMQTLCRTLQAERTLLINSLKENNIERPPLTPLLAAPPAPPPAQGAPNSTNKKVDTMAANCAQLKQSLKEIQSQLTTLTNSKAGPKEEPAKVEKPKKSKSKKSKAEKQAQKLAAEKTEVKERENDDSTDKSILEETNIVATEDRVLHEENDKPEDNIDSQAMESLIQAMNVANINRSDVEVVEDDNTSKDVEEMTDGDVANISLNEIVEDVIDNVGVVSEDDITEQTIDDNVPVNDVNQLGAVDFDTKETETVSDDKLNDTNNVINPIKTIPQVNGDEKLTAQDANDSMTNESNETSIERNDLTHAHILSPEKEKEAKESQALQEKSQADTQGIEIKPVSMES